MEASASTPLNDLIKLTKDKFILSVGTAGRFLPAAVRLHISLTCDLSTLCLASDVLQRFAFLWTAEVSF